MKVCDKIICKKNVYNGHNKNQICGLGGNYIIVDINTNNNRLLII